MCYFQNHVFRISLPISVYVIFLAIPLLKLEKATITGRFLIERIFFVNIGTFDLKQMVQKIFSLQIFHFEYDLDDRFRDLLWIKPGSNPFS